MGVAHVTTLQGEAIKAFHLPPTHNYPLFVTPVLLRCTGSLLLHFNCNNNKFI